MGNGFVLADPGLQRAQAYIGGAWIDADDGSRFPVVNPADGRVIGEAPALGAPECERAIAAAAAALPAWRARPAKERSAILRRWYQLVLDHQEDLAILLTAEGGKPLAEARSEIAYGAAFLEWFAEEGKRVYGDVIPHQTPGRRLVVLKEPVGVVAAITPWNFPSAMITRKAAPALAVGCTMVVKPAEDTPLSALALAVLAERAGVPAGVFNVVPCRDPVPVAEALTASPLVRKLSFTGSVEVGRLLMRACADTLKKVSFELGGNAPFIVFDDADLEAAVTGAMTAKYRNAGQTCICANRFMIQDGLYESFCRRLAERVGPLRVGPGLEAGIQQGPLISTEAVTRVETLVSEAVALGARVITGGRRHPCGERFFEPTVLADVTPAMRIAREEIFGPVAAVLRFSDEDQAVAIANDTDYGLAAYFYARDLGRVWRVAERLEYGMVAVNEGMFSTEIAPFGGVKQSGFGREGSKYGIDEYVQTKYLCLGGI